MAIRQAAGRDIPQKRGRGGQKLGKNGDAAGRRPTHSSKKGSCRPKTGEKWRSGRPPAEAFLKKGVLEARNWGKMAIRLVAARNIPQKRGLGGQRLGKIGAGRRPSIICMLAELVRKFNL